MEGETSIFLYEVKLFLFLQVGDRDFNVFQMCVRDVHTSFIKTSKEIGFSRLQEIFVRNEHQRYEKETARKFCKRPGF